MTSKIVRIISWPLAVITMALLISCLSKQDGKHLFVLSGQSNMLRLDADSLFTPLVATEFGKENVIVVKYARGGQPIRRWYRDWNAPQGFDIEVVADLYDTLMTKVFTRIQDKHLASVTFIWMQGERDAREGFGEVYEESLQGLYHQLSHDLNRNDVNFVIGKLSDFDMTNEKYPDWTAVRKTQNNVANSNNRFSLVETDDLNDGIMQSGKEVINDLHMTKQGYATLGKRFAEKAIYLIKNNE